MGELSVVQALIVDTSGQLMQPTYFLSDLHVFSRRSLQPQFEGPVQRAADVARRMILGGDIFDFMWSTVGDRTATVAAAEHWLRKLVAPRPGCQFEYILGNHDCHPDWIARLKRLAAKLPNFRWHDHFYHERGDVFLHGDVLDGAAHPVALQMRRARWARHGRRPEILDGVYDAAVTLGLHRRAAQLVHPPRRAARKLLDYLAHVGHHPDRGLRRVFFGHTHLALNNFAYRNVLFQNGGAPIAGLEFRLIEVLPHEAE